MSIVRLYRETVGDDGTRLFEYREAWACLLYTSPSPRD